MGLKKENLRFREHNANELAHYAKACVDVEYKFPFGSGDWQELEGIANRTDYDLRQHQRGIRTLNKWFENDRDLTNIELSEEAKDYSKGPLSYFDDEKKQRYIPLYRFGPERNSFHRLPAILGELSRRLRRR